VPTSASARGARRSERGSASRSVALTPSEAGDGRLCRLELLKALVAPAPSWPLLRRPSMPAAAFATESLAGWLGMRSGMRRSRTCASYILMDWLASILWQHLGQSREQLDTSRERPVSPGQHIGDRPKIIKTTPPEPPRSAETGQAVTADIRFVSDHQRLGDVSGGRPKESPPSVCSWPTRLDRIQGQRPAMTSIRTGVEGAPGQIVLLSDRLRPGRVSPGTPCQIRNTRRDGC
jgi:hypothetical protein